MAGVSLPQGDLTAASRLSLAQSGSFIIHAMRSTITPRGQTVVPVALDLHRKGHRLWSF